MNILSDFNLVQHVLMPTHNKDKQSTIIRDVNVQIGISDHNAVIFSIISSKPHCLSPINRTFRTFKRVDFELLNNDMFNLVTQSLFTIFHNHNNFLPSADEVASLFETQVLAVIDKHAPEISKKVPM
jgi:hypothetical protein